MKASAIAVPAKASAAALSASRAREKSVNVAPPTAHRRGDSIGQYRGLDGPFAILVPVGTRPGLLAALEDGVALLDERLDALGEVRRAGHL